MAADGRLDLFTRRTVWVDTGPLEALDLDPPLDTDDVLTVELGNGQTIVSPARTVARSALAGAEAVSTTRLELEDA